MKKVIFAAIAVLVSCGNPSQNRKNAERFFNEKKYQNALVEINRAIQLEPDSVGHYVVRMAIYDVMGQYKEEVTDLSKIIELNKKTNSKSINVYHQRAFAHTQLGLYNEALFDIDYFIENRDTAGSLAEAYINKASILYKLNDYEKSTRYYELALKENITKELESQAFVGLANLEKSPQKALELLDKSILTDDKNSLAFGARGALYMESEKIREAYDDFNKAISLNPDDATTNFNMGQLFANYSDNMDSAIIYFENAIRLSPQSKNNDVVYMHLAVVKHRLGNSKNALPDFKKAENINPKNDLLFYNYAMVLSDLQRNSEALKKITKAIGYNSKDSEYYNLKGSILIDLSKYNEAEADFLTAIELNPNYGDAYYNLGYLNGEIGNHSKSINYYGKAVEFGCDLEATLVNMAIQKIKINKTSSACSDLTKAYALGRKDIKPLMNKYCK